MSVGDAVDSAVEADEADRPTAVAVEYCGEWFPIAEGGSLTIGRDADLVIDENPFLHRHLLKISESDGLWLLANVGSRLSVTVSDAAGRLQSWLAPGARLPLVFGRMSVVFTAGPTTYELNVHTASPPFAETSSASPDGVTTVGQLTLTVSQKLLILSLAEPMLQRDGSGMGEIPTNAAAARRLGWSSTRFSRKLDNVCEKFERIGVQGLRGDSRSYATNRRARLVEYAVSARLVTRVDLPLLDQPQPPEAMQ
ncbi:hypothetical protein [Agromyces sp. PvR057]|uniref:hypothetical protein n=1 Tax=Agromyces sp. PvR057 TaxID=3156403 RepID=UPI0033962F00